MSFKELPDFSSRNIQKTLFILAGLMCLLPIMAPPYALALGLVLGLAFGNPFASWTRKASKLLLQIAVVGLGFGMNLGKVLEASRTGVLFTMATIVGTLVLGYLVGKWLKVDQTVSHLISSGTAICGGSAIAAVGPVLNADEQEMSVSLGTVFILNSVALFVFPLLGNALHLSQNQFGIWSAIAIHDTSSVVGAASKFGEEALGIATTVKLARALWIIPLVLLTAFVFKRKDAKPVIPYFIGFFLLASVARTYVPVVAQVSSFLVNMAKTGLILTLFFIGSGLTRDSLKLVGIRPLIQGIFLWAVISAISLWTVKTLL